MHKYVLESPHKDMKGKYGCLLLDPIITYQLCQSDIHTII